VGGAVGGFVGAGVGGVVGGGVGGSVGALQLLMQASADSVPLRLSTHWPVAASQL
jgi:hypothetical protein